ncbi:MAG: dTDP-4-dehydrorhamnose 3,5-epimerase family protein [Phycisphaerae bacterium]|nr:dTDP-4-dehydrorhamnose 3,5-epimerase family protein [Phycisphaerae bacterium]
MRLDGTATLPDGVRLLPLQMNADPRGVFTEVFRQQWAPEFQPIQWNFVRSEANVLRGVHVHVRHSDYLVVLAGRARIGLVDLRPGSPTEGLRAELEVHGEGLQSLCIPPGVAHGFYFHEPALHLYAVTHYWDPCDELGCRFDDLQLGLSWPTRSPLLSPRDERLPPLTALRGQVPAWSAGAASPPAIGVAAASHAFAR